MRYLLDTNIISDARLQRSPSLMAWLSDQEVDDLGISVITILELERGVRRKERADPEGARPRPRDAQLQGLRARGVALLSPWEAG